MDAFRIILFAADFSDDSIAAFQVACSLALEKATRLIVLHVVEPDWAERRPDYLKSDAVPADRTESMREFLVRRLREVYAPSRPLAVEYRTCEGPAAREIIRVAEDAEANLIAMGTHGRSGIRRLLTGSVARSVLTAAHCPVLALRSGGAGAKTGEIKVILHPTDFSKASETALKVARSLARECGARLVLLHVAPVDIYLEARLAADLDPADRGLALDELRKRIDGPDLKCRVETRLTRGFESDEICRVARDADCDLIVMGTHGRSGMSRLLMGSTAESVICRADWPVLVVKSSSVETALERADAGSGAAVAS